MGSHKSWQPGWGWGDSSPSTTMCVASADPQGGALARGTWGQECARLAVEGSRHHQLPAQGAQALVAGGGLEAARPPPPLPEPRSCGVLAPHSVGSAHLCQMAAVCQTLGQTPRALEGVCPQRRSGLCLRRRAQGRGHRLCLEYLRGERHGRSCVCVGWECICATCPGEGDPEREADEWMPEAGSDEKVTGSSIRFFGVGGANVLELARGVGA